MFDTLLLPSASNLLSLALTQPHLLALAAVGLFFLLGKIRTRRPLKVAPALPATATDAAETAAATTAHSLREIRLRPRNGYLKLHAALSLAVLAMIAGWSFGASAEDPGLTGKVLILAVLAGIAWNGVRMWLWELRYDSIGVSSPDWFLRRRARLWRELVAVGTDGPLVLQLHFADGLVMALPNQIEGRTGLLATARTWLPGQSQPG